MATRNHQYFALFQRQPLLDSQRNTGYKHDILIGRGYGYARSFGIRVFDGALPVQNMQTRRLELTVGLLTPMSMSKQQLPVAVKKVSQEFAQVSLKRRCVEADFEGGAISSDGGVLLLRQVDRVLGLSEAVSKVLSDPRRQFGNYVESSGMSRRRIIVEPKRL